MKLLHQTKALADETRLRLLGLLASHELNVGEIVQVMGMGQSRVSRHLKILTDAGLVACQRHGLWAFYSASAANGSRSLLAAVLEGLAGLPEHKADLDAAAQILSERRRSTTRFFDGVASDWKRLSREMLGDFELGPAIMGSLAASGAQVGTVVDLGCGPGLLMGHLAEAANRVIGVDNSPRMLEAAAKLLPEGPEISLRIGDLEHLPLRDGEADAAVMSLVLHHLAAPQAGIAEMGRVVRPGGHAVLADFQLHDNEALRSLYGDRWLGFSPADLQGWMERAGFREVACQRHAVNLGLTLLVITARREEFSI
jgi:ArsR family transcriptional regulator